MGRAESRRRASYPDEGHELRNRFLERLFGHERQEKASQVIEHTREHLKIILAESGLLQIASKKL